MEGFLPFFRDILTSYYTYKSLILNDNFYIHVPTSCHVFWGQKSLKNDPKIPTLEVLKRYF
jgi:hypothetical protein